MMIKSIPKLRQMAFDFLLFVNDYALLKTTTVSERDTWFLLEKNFLTSMEEDRTANALRVAPQLR